MLYLKNLFHLTGLLSSIILPAFFPVSLSAAELHQFAIHYSSEMKAEDCALTARYSEKHPEQLSYPGKFSANDCMVTMTHQDYESRFRFCYLSGFNLYKASKPEMIECLVQKRDQDYIFLASLMDTDRKDEQVMCYFTCIGGDER